MTLHSAIETVLKKAGTALTTQQIADELNKNGLYRKKDDSPIAAFQIHGRTKNYPKIFSRDGVSVSLLKQPVVNSHRGDLEKSIKSKSSNTKSSFNPISSSDSSVLILGTMPGELSLATGEYYAHPSNKFWKVISAITKNTMPDSYAEKISILNKSKIAIWDVANTAMRKGSLDSNIIDEIPNDLDNFLIMHENLRVIGFNGLAAENLFNKYFQRSDKIKYISLPSTSATNTRISFGVLCVKWQQLLSY